MTVRIRDNFKWERRPFPPDDVIEINQYSGLMMLVLCRACDIAERHNHNMVRVDHFIEALLAEPNARMRLHQLGYADNDEARSQRFQQLSRTTVIGSGVPADALAYSLRLRLWGQAAQQVAERRDQ